VEEALGYKTLVDAGNLTQEEIAKRVGKNRATVANSLRLLKLPDVILSALDSGSISAGHARALLAVQDVAVQKKLFRRILEQELSVREVEKEAAKTQGQGVETSVTSQAKKPAKAVELQALEERLIERLGTKINIRGSYTKGKIEISYFSLEDLERIISLLTGEE
jgi:ParB family chromosome partitioning protein